MGSCVGQPACTGAFPVYRVRTEKAAHCMRLTVRPRMRRVGGRGAAMALMLVRWFFYFCLMSAVTLLCLRSVLLLCLRRIAVIVRVLAVVLGALGVFYVLASLLRLRRAGAIHATCG